MKISTIKGYCTKIADFITKYLTVSLPIDRFLSKRYREYLRQPGDNEWQSKYDEACRAVQKFNLNIFGEMKKLDPELARRVIDNVEKTNPELFTYKNESY